MVHAQRSVPGEQVPSVLLGHGVRVLRRRGRVDLQDFSAHQTLTSGGRLRRRVSQKVGHSPVSEQWLQSLENGLQSLQVPESHYRTSDLPRGDAPDLERHDQQETSQVLDAWRRDVTFFIPVTQKSFEMCGARTVDPFDTLK